MGTNIDDRTTPSMIIIITCNNNTKNNGTPTDSNEADGSKNHCNSMRFAAKRTPKSWFRSWMLPTALTMATSQTHATETMSSSIKRGERRKSALNLTISQPHNPIHTNTHTYNTHQYTSNLWSHLTERY